MSTVYKLAFASSALPYRMIGILNKCLNKHMPNGLYEINSLCNEQYSLCLKKTSYPQMFKDRTFCCLAIFVFTYCQTDSFKYESSTFVFNYIWQWRRKLCKNLVRKN